MTKRTALNPNIIVINTAMLILADVLAWNSRGSLSIAAFILTLVLALAAIGSSLYNIRLDKERKWRAFYFIVAGASMLSFVTNISWLIMLFVLLNRLS